MPQIIAALLFITPLLTFADNIIDEQIKCYGTGPFWTLNLGTSTWADGHASNKTVQVHEVQFAIAGDETSLTTYKNEELKTAVSENDLSLFHVGSRDGSLSAFVDFKTQGEQACNDGMSDLLHPYSVSFLINKKAFNGCCQSSIYKAK